MASILRQIVAGPRARHPEANLDLCYVTDNIVATSGPATTYPKRAYRNPTDQLVKFLDEKHGTEWSIWEFRAEGTGYPDSEVYHRIHHFPWPDHHPPPFALIPPLMASMRNWLQNGETESHQIKSGNKKRTAVVHCKAGKGRSGTVACSYLISEEGWDMSAALQRFTERRMRVGFGAGVSIPSQLRWIRYVDRWAKQMDKRYVERAVEIVEIHVFGLRDGVKVAVDGYVDEGRRIKSFHVFTRHEKIVVDDGKKSSRTNTSNSNNVMKPTPAIKSRSTGSIPDTTTLTSPATYSPMSSSTEIDDPTSSGSTVLLKPHKPIILPTSDINIDLERRNKASYTGFTMVTSVAHVWFNAYFEGGYEGNDSGVFDIEWDAMDGIKGSARKGTRAMDRIKILWRYPKSDKDHEDLGRGRTIKEPEKGEPVPEGKPADWRGADNVGQDHSAQKIDASVSNPKNSTGIGGAMPLAVREIASEQAQNLGKELGLRRQRDDSADVSRASSVRPDEGGRQKLSGDIIDASQEKDASDDEGVKTHGPEGEDFVTPQGEEGEPSLGESHERPETKIGDVGIGKVADVVKSMTGKQGSEGESGGGGTAQDSESRNQEKPALPPR
ncbi:MAG: hypothetical protein Q9227_001534 [Pyrenula ochraceoflavens]